MSMVTVHFDLLLCEGIEKKSGYENIFSVIQRQKIIILYKPEIL